MKWGLIPSWAKDTKLQYSIINTRARKISRPNPCWSLVDLERSIERGRGFELRGSHLWAEQRDGGDPNRMPCVLGESDLEKWLGEEPTTNEQLLALLKPCPDDWLEIYPVDKKVGNVRNKGAELILPI